MVSHQPRLGQITHNHHHPLTVNVTQTKNESKSGNTESKMDVFRFVYFETLQV